MSDESNVNEDVGFSRYIVELNKEIDEFNLWWLAEHKKDPEHFPLVMPRGEWDEQFRIWSCT